jgi:hypothetical protein
MVSILEEKTANLTGAVSRELEKKFDLYLHSRLSDELSSLIRRKIRDEIRYNLDVIFYVYIYNNLEVGLNDAEE